MVEFAFAAARIVVALFLVFLNGFFVAAEFAFVRLRSASVETLVQEGHRSASVVQEAIQNLDDYLAVSQLGITISSLGLGWIGEPAVAVLVDPILTPLLPASAVHVVSVAVGFGIITFLHVVYGELAPKTLAIQEAERIALVVAPPMKVFYYIFIPGIILFNGTANLSTRLIGVEPASETDETHTEEEIMTILSEAGEAGRVDMEEVEMIEHVFDLDDTSVREIMRPRPDVTSIPADTRLADLRSIAIEAEYTRYPVVDESEQVIGFIDVKDILRISESIDETETITARDLARDIVSRRVFESAAGDDAPPGVIAVAVGHERHRPAVEVPLLAVAVRGQSEVEDGVLGVVPVRDRRRVGGRLLVHCERQDPRSADAEERITVVDTHLRAVRFSHTRYHSPTVNKAPRASRTTGNSRAEEDI